MTTERDSLGDDVNGIRVYAERLLATRKNGNTQNLAKFLLDALAENERLRQEADRLYWLCEDLIGRADAVDGLTGGDITTFDAIDMLMAAKDGAA